MKILKWILIIIAIIIVVPLIAAIFIKKDYSVTEEIVVNKPKQEVFDYVKYVKNVNKFNKWALEDPNQKVAYKGTDGTVGFISAWDSDKGSKGEQEIKHLTEGERVEWELRFEKPFAGVSPSVMTTQAAGDNQTKVTWKFDGHMPYPMNFMCLFVDGMMSKSMSESLVLLKQQLEK